jgi:hypothetical protein
MTKSITITIQIEPDLDLSEENLEKCQAAMYEACYKLESLGFVKCNMLVGKDLYKL